MGRRFVHWPAFFGAMAVVALIALGLRAFSAMSFVGSFLIVLFAMLLNGWLAAWEDEQPGGFNHPNDQTGS